MIAAQSNRLSVTKGNSTRDVGTEVGVSNKSISYANTVLDWVPGLAGDVVSGALPLNKAYDIARERNDVTSCRCLI